MRYSDFFHSAKLYHASPRKNVEAILNDGLKVSFYGAVHGAMEIAPPEPVVYLSRDEESNNLHTNIGTDYVIFSVDFAGLDPNKFYPDDAFLVGVANADFIEDADEVVEAIGCTHEEAEVFIEELENADEHEIAALLKPFWKYWLKHPKGGEVSYAADIPPHLITIHRE